MNNVFDNEQLTDEALIKKLSSFTNGMVTANGSNFHYMSDGIRASNAWYQAFPRDIEYKGY